MAENPSGIPVVLVDNASGTGTKKSKRWLKVVLWVLLACMVLFPLMYFLGIPALQYGIARLHIKNEDYEKAYYALVRSGGFSDSEEYLARIKALPTREEIEYSSEVTAEYKYSYDERGNLVKEVRELNGEEYQTVTRTYHPSGVLLSEVGDKSDFSVDFYVTDDEGNLYVTEGNVCSTYDGSGRILKSEPVDLKNDFGLTYKYQYDDAGNLLKKVCLDNFGEVSYTLEYVYSAGKLRNEVMKNPDGSERSTVAAYFYDEDGNLEREERVSSDGTKTSVEYAYDKYGLCVEKDEEGVIFSYSDFEFYYISGENLTVEYNREQYKKALSSIEKGDYEEACTILCYLGTYKDAEELYARFEILPSRISVRTSGSLNGTVTDLTYDKERARISEKITRPSGAVEEYTYDGDGKLLRVTYKYEDTLYGKNVDETVVYTYDDDGKLCSVGPASTYLKISAEEYVYDSAGILIKKSVQGYNTGGSEVYYNTDGTVKMEIKGLSSESKTFVVYTYNDAGKPLEQKCYTYSGPYNGEAVLPGDAVLLTTVFYTYNEAENSVLEETVRGDDVNESCYHAYDEDGRLIREISTSFSGSKKNLAYHYDSQGNLQKTVEHRGREGSTSTFLEYEVEYSKNSLGVCGSSYNSYTKEITEYSEFVFFYDAAE